MVWAFKCGTVNRIHGHDVANFEHVKRFCRMSGSDFGQYILAGIDAAPVLVGKNDFLPKSKSAGSTSSFHMRRG
jgi:hypothetical protein